MNFYSPLLRLSLVLNETVLPPHFPNLARRLSLMVDPDSITDIKIREDGREGRGRVEEAAARAKFPAREDPKRVGEIPREDF